jgi:hypothetical protein
VKRKRPLHGAPNVEVIYDTSPRTATRVGRGGSLMEGLRLSMLRQDGHDGHKDLRGSGHRSVIPYVHGRVCCIVVCALFKL